MLRGFPKDFRDSDYVGIQMPRTVTGTGTVDIGDLVALKRRVKQGEPVGELGLEFADDPPGTPLDARIFKVRTIDPQGPAAKSGITVGDIVVSVDGVDVTGASAGSAWTLLRAPPGTKLALGLQRGATVAITLAAP
jgi:C-terminal processing protease CtpA/Prc